MTGRVIPPRSTPARPPSEAPGLLVNTDDLDAVAGVIHDFWTVRGARLVHAPPPIPPDVALPVQGWPGRLGFLIGPVSGDWVPVVDSTRRFAEATLARRLGAVLARKVHYRVPGATRSRVFQREAPRVGTTPPPLLPPWDAPPPGSRAIVFEGVRANEYESLPTAGPTAAQLRAQAQEWFMRTWTHVHDAAIKGDSREVQRLLASSPEAIDALLSTQTFSVLTPASAKLIVDVVSHVGLPTELAATSAFRLLQAGALAVDGQLLRRAMQQFAALREERWVVALRVLARQWESQGLSEAATLVLEAAMELHVLVPPAKD